VDSIPQASLDEYNHGLFWPCSPLAGFGLRLPSGPGPGLILTGLILTGLVLYGPVL